VRTKSTYLVFVFCGLLVFAISGICAAFDVYAELGANYSATNTAAIRHLPSLTVRSGYSSEVFIIGWDKPGNWVEWEIEIPEAGEYNFLMLYATYDDPNIVGVKRNLKLRQPDESLVTVFEEVLFPTFGNSGRNGWALKVTEPIHLEAGKQTLHLEALDFGVNVEGKVSLNVVWVGLLRAPKDATITDAMIISAVDKQLGL
jgi:hypothetical protein